VTGEPKGFTRFRSSRLNLNYLLVATLALCLIRLWLMPLPSSFWVDELGTVFVVHHGKDAPTLRDAPQVPDSIYYALPALAEKIAGFSEISYRFFSVLAMGAALLVIARLAARLIDPRAAWFAVFGCLALRSFNYEAADARPYALATLVLASAILLLIRWLDSGRIRDGLLFAAVAAVLWWVHLILWPFYLVLALYAGFRVFTKRTPVSPMPLALIFLLIAVGVAPVALRSLALLHQAGTHVVVPRPHFRELTAQLQLSLLTGLCTVAFLVSRYFGWQPPRAVVSTAAVVLIAAWWLVDPLVIYLFSSLSHTSVFVGRYMYPAVPGVVFMILLLVAMVAPPEHWKQLALLLGVGVLIFAGHWNQLWPPHHNSDWRAASQALRTWTRGEDVPVICPSPFIEARPPVWRPDYPIDGFLYSNLAVYPMGGKVYPFPFESSTPVEDYARQLVDDRLSHSRFAIFGGDRAVNFWRAWFSKQPGLLDWNSRMIGIYGDVELVVFEPPARRL
jgi:hypothetical protein